VEDLVTGDLTEALQGAYGHAKHFISRSDALHRY
jgi:hypothetical protein